MDSSSGDGVQAAAQPSTRKLVVNPAAFSRLRNSKVNDGNRTELTANFILWRMLANFDTKNLLRSQPFSLGKTSRDTDFPNRPVPRHGAKTRCNWYAGR